MAIFDANTVGPLKYIQTYEKYSNILSQQVTLRRSLSTSRPTRSTVQQHSLTAGNNEEVIEYIQTYEKYCTATSSHSR